MAPRPSLPPSTKKRKLNTDKSEQHDTEALIQQLETQLSNAVANKTALNPLADLLDIARNATEVAVLSKSIYAFYRVFVTLLTAGMLHGPSPDETTKAVRSWIGERLHGYGQLLAGLLKDEESSLKTSALNILMSLQKHLSSSVSKTSSSGPQWHNSHFKQVVIGLLTCPPSTRLSLQAKKRKTDGGNDGKWKDGKVDAEVRDLFIDKWLSECDDVRWFFLREATGVLSTYDKNQNPNVPVNLLSILERLTTFPTEVSELNQWWVEELGKNPPKPKSLAEADEEEEIEAEPSPQGTEEDDWRKYFEDEAPVAEQKKTNVRLHKLTIHQSLHSLGAHRAVLTRAWLTLLPHLSMGSEESQKTLSTRVLNVMHRGVMPHLTRAVLVMDWIGTCVDYGGNVGLLSLNALFVLMKEYNLDYPQFYTRLYTFFDRDVLHLKHRARFFRMTELFLSSTHLPVNLLASFVKRLARLSLSAPPAAIIMIIPLTYNILKKHPSLMVMIHRDDMDGTEKDPFNDSETNPTMTGAIDSSLWELYTHRQHYHSAVSTLAKIFAEAFTKPNYALEDFLDHTYATLFDTEVKRKIKKVPALAVEPTHQAWFIDPTLNPAHVGIVEDLWTFT